MQQLTKLTPSKKIRLIPFFPSFLFLNICEAQQVILLLSKQAKAQGIYKSFIFLQSHFNIYSL